LQKTPAVAKALETFGDRKRDVAAPVIKLASTFASRTGGMTADLWTNLPDAITGLTPESGITLAERAIEFLEFGGSVTLHFISSGSSVLQNAGEVFDEWCSVLKKIARQGNAVLIAFLRATPKFFRQTGANGKLTSDQTDSMRRVLQLTGVIAETDAESALAAFRSSATALRRVTLEQFEKWIDIGLRETCRTIRRNRGAAILHSRRVSRMRYCRTRGPVFISRYSNGPANLHRRPDRKDGRDRTAYEHPQESRIGDGKTIYLPSAVAEIRRRGKRFQALTRFSPHTVRADRVRTFAKDTTPLRAAFKELSSFYESTAEQRDAFSLAGYIEDLDKVNGFREKRAGAEEADKAAEDSDYREVLSRSFPSPVSQKRSSARWKRANRRASHERIASCAQDLDLDEAVLRGRLGRTFFDLPNHPRPFEAALPDHDVRRCRPTTRDTFLRTGRFRRSTVLSKRIWILTAETLMRREKK
jgi:hypothetical protein